MFTLFLLAVAAWMAVGINHGLDFAKLVPAKAVEFLTKFSTRADISALIELGGIKNSAKVWKSYDKVVELRTGEYYQQIRCMDRKVLGRLATLMLVLKGAVQGPFGKYSDKSKERAKLLSDYCVNKHPLSR